MPLILINVFSTCSSLQLLFADLTQIIFVIFLHQRYLMFDIMNNFFSGFFHARNYFPSLSSAYLCPHFYGCLRLWSLFSPRFRPLLLFYIPFFSSSSSWKNKLCSLACAPVFANFSYRILLRFSSAICSKRISNFIAISFMEERLWFHTALFLIIVN